MDKEGGERVKAFWLSYNLFGERSGKAIGVFRKSLSGQFLIDIYI